MCSSDLLLRGGAKDAPAKRSRRVELLMLFEQPRPSGVTPLHPNRAIHFERNLVVGIGEVKAPFPRRGEAHFGVGFRESHGFAGEPDGDAIGRMGHEVINMCIFFYAWHLPCKAKGRMACPFPLVIRDDTRQIGMAKVDGEMQAFPHNGFVERPLVQ